MDKDEITSPYELFDVTLTGNVKPGFKTEQVILSVARLFKLPAEKVSPLFNGSPCVIKQNIPHKAAFQYQQKLDQLGAQVRLKRRPVVAPSPEFSLVPEGEEQTAFETLASRLAQGVEVSCAQCGTVQKHSPYCSGCGKQLIGSLVLAPPPAAPRRRPIFWLGLIAMLIAVLDFSRLQLNLFPQFDLIWFAPALALLGVGLIVLDRIGLNKTAS